MDELSYVTTLSNHRGRQKSNRPSLQLCTPYISTGIVLSHRSKLMIQYDLASQHRFITDIDTHTMNKPVSPSEKDRQQLGQQVASSSSSLTDANRASPTSKRRATSNHSEAATPGRAFLSADATTRSTIQEPHSIDLNNAVTPSEEDGRQQLDPQVTRSSSSSLTDANKASPTSKRRTAGNRSEAATPGHPLFPADAATRSTIPEPRSIDLVFGLGRGYRYEGNRTLKEMVKGWWASYEVATSNERIRIKRIVVDHLLSQPGNPRFLTLDPTQHVWKELTYKESVQKTMTAFSNLGYKYKQMTDVASGGASKLVTPCAKRMASSSDSGEDAAPPNKLARSYKTDTTNNDLGIPRSIDIVCGGPFFRAPGNVAFSQLIERSVSRYEAADKNARMKINREIVELVKAQPGAPRFLTKNPTTGVWEELSFKKSVSKTSQTFRNFLPRSKPMSKATSDDESEFDGEAGVEEQDGPTRVVPGMVQDFLSVRGMRKTTSDDESEVNTPL
jgi:hypothetical protein